MPELPEVETVRRSISDKLIHQTIAHVVIRNHRLRWPIPAHLPKKLQHATVLDITRRGKYLLFSTHHGTLILHLGMSGRVHLFQGERLINPHDHVDIIFSDQWTLRYTDPRRFGCLLWTEQDPQSHELLNRLGPEPLSTQFTGPRLYQQAQGRKILVKSFLMDSHIVVGIGNIYANEALFHAGISPLTPAGAISKEKYQALVSAAKKVLLRAIKAGGTTLKDFHNSDGNPGEFSQKLYVYDREHQPCRHCHTPLVKAVVNQRSTFYCPRCQT